MAGELIVQTYLTMYRSAGSFNFLQASCKTSVRYVPGETLTVVLRRSVAMTTTCDAMTAEASMSIQQLRFKIDRPRDR